ncbi:UDP-2,3-diacylglucosamine diphosphatase [Paralcaligenes ginsengisoli]
MLNKIRLAGAVWFASDIHLGPQTPATRAAFHAFLDKACAQADALILCGDIFDAWIGDDFALAAPPDWLIETMRKFRQTAQAIPLWLGHGNRDFLMGATLVDDLGAQLLPDTCCLQTDYGDVLLSHGDEYCTEDLAYQRFRRVVRNPRVQRLFLSLSLSLRSKIAAWARGRSKSSNRYKTNRIMDVAPSAVEQAFTATDINLMVHGHTHRPAFHRIQIGTRACTRIVLPDWDYDHSQPPRGGWLTIDRNGPEFCRLP